MLTKYLIELTNKGYYVYFKPSLFNDGLEIRLHKDDYTVALFITNEDLKDVTLNEDEVVLFHLKRMEEQFENGAGQ